MATRPRTSRPVAHLVRRPETARPRRLVARRYRAAPPLGWLIPGLVLLLGFHYAAVLAGGWYAFTDWNGLSTPNFVGLRNFQQIFNDPAAKLAFVNTIVLAIAFVVAVNVIGLVLALALHRAVKTRNLLRSA